MKFCFFLTFILSIPAWGQIKHQTKVSKEIPGKTKEEIKEMVLFNGAMEGIKKFAGENGKDFALFSKKLNERFEVYFTQHKEYELTQKFGKNPKDLLPQDREAFLATLELSRENLYRKFTNALEAIQNYSVKNGIVEITLDQINVERLLNKFINDENKQYTKIWLNTEIHLENLTWNQFELASVDSFKEPIEKSWHKWLQEHLPTNVEGTSICKSSCQNVYESWILKKQDEALGFAGPEYLNGIWANVSISIRPGKPSAFTREKNFEWNGRIVFTDINTKRLLTSVEIPQERFSFREMDQKKINSNFASLIYRSGVSGLTNINSKIQTQRSLNRVTRLSIKGHKQLLDIQLLMNELKIRGTSLALEAQLDFFKSNEAEILCFYQGEEKSFSDLLSRLKELKLSQGYKIVNEYNGVHHVLKLVND